MTELQTEIESVLESYEDCWRRRDFPALRALWDRSEPEPIYVAEEGIEPFIGWDAIEGYWDATHASLPRVTVRTSRLVTRLVAERIALAFYHLHWNAQIGNGPAMGGDVRVSALLRRTDEGWRFFHYVEAPIAALTQLRQVYQNNVDSDFPG